MEMKANVVLFITSSKEGLHTVTSSGPNIGSFRKPVKKRLLPIRIQIRLIKI